jgi:hypothetical protein
MDTMGYQDSNLDYLYGPFEYHGYQDLNVKRATRIISQWPFFLFQIATRR